jgi:hypothetical protein
VLGERLSELVTTHEHCNRSAIDLYKHLPQFRAPKPITKLTIKTMGIAKNMILMTAADVTAIMPKPNVAANNRNTELNICQPSLYFWAGSSQVNYQFAQNFPRSSETQCRHLLWAEG